MPPYGAIAEPEPVGRRRAPMVVELWQLAWPACLRNFLNCACDRATLTLVGHYGNSTAGFDGAGVGKMLSNVSGLSIGLGLTLGLSTACSQAHGSNSAAKENGIHLRRCCMALVVALLAVLLPATVFAEDILLAADQPPAVARTSARFAQVNAVGVPFFWAAAALATVCDSLQLTKLGMYSQVVASVVQVGITSGLVVGGGWGYLGMAAGRSIGGVLQLMLIIGMIHRTPGLPSRVWGPPMSWSDVRSKAVNGRALVEFVGLALPSAIVWWIEWWAFEGLTVLVGLLRDPEITLAAHGIIFNTVVTLYQFFQGIGIALCAATGKRIGARRGGDVPALITICVTTSAILAACVSSLLYFGRRDIARAFTSNSSIIDEVDENMLGAVLSVPGYAVLMTLAGACRGANRQKLVAAGTTSGYVGGVVLAFYLGYRIGKPRPLMGVWLGNASALAWAALCACGVALFTDWATVRKIRSKSQLQKAAMDVFDGGMSQNSESAMLLQIQDPSEPI
mmetsp:Transcript_8562/g.22068  ORF Transcript_8562/g.22068 Transcript_8562/m.22068 type:complete len:508 (-) Transcript_8562:8-1531(-)